MGKSFQQRRAIVISSTLIQNGHYLTILQLEGTPKGRISLRTQHQAEEGARYTVQGSENLWSIVKRN